MAVNFDSIPERMKKHHNWMVLATAPKLEDGKPVLNADGQAKIRKCPISPLNNLVGLKTDKDGKYNCMSSFDVATKYASKRSNVTALNFVIEKRLEIIGIDLDNCVVNGVVHSKAIELISHFDSYTEYSPSGNGIHIFISGTLEDPKGKKGWVHAYPFGVELFWDRCSLSVTGNVVKALRPECPHIDTIQDRQYLAEKFHKRLEDSDPQQYLKKDEGSLRTHKPITNTEHHTLHDILSMLKKVKPSGDNFTACCPSHNDKDPSLSIKEANGLILMNCHSDKGCTTQSICAALGIKVSSLFPELKSQDKHVPPVTLAPHPVVITPIEEHEAEPQDSVEPEPPPHQVETPSKVDPDETVKVVYKPEVFLPQGGSSTVSDTSINIGRTLAKEGSFYDRGGMLFKHKNVTTNQVKLDPVQVAGIATLFEDFCALRKMDSKWKVVHAVPTDSICRQIFNSHSFIKQFPEIKTVTLCPVIIERDGKGVAISAYDKETGILASGAPVKFVTLDNAKELLHNSQLDFNFPTQGDLARSLASIITPALIQGGMLGGRAPIDLSVADQSQTGKGFRNQVTAAMYNQTINSVVQSKGGVGSLDESFDIALLKSGNFICFDNVRGKFDSPKVESFCTEALYMARIPYGRGVEIDPSSYTLQMTCNKAELTEDLSKRCSIVHMTKQKEGFIFRIYPGDAGTINLLQYVHNNQPYYLGAIFAVINEWLRRGKQVTNETRHDFRRWAQVLDWIMINIMDSGPLLDGHKESQKQTVTPYLGWLRDVVIALAKEGYKDRELRTGQIGEIITEETDIEIPGYDAAAHDVDDAYTSMCKALGLQLRKCFKDNEEIEFGDLKIRRFTGYDSLRGKDVKLYEITDV